MQCVFCRELDHDHHHHLTSNTPRPPKQDSLSLCLCPSARAISQDALRRGNSRAVAAFESHQKAPRGPSHGMHRHIPHHMAATGSDTCVFFFLFCCFVMRMCYLNSLSGDHSPSHMYVPCSCVACNAHVIPEASSRALASTAWRSPTTGVVSATRILAAHSHHEHTP